MMAKVQKLLSAVLIVALLIFGFYGMTQVDPVVFNISNPTFFQDGYGGFVGAIAIYVYSTYGQYMVMNFSKDAENPTREAGLAYGKGWRAGLGMIQDFAEVIIGEDPMNIEKIWENGAAAIVAATFFCLALYLIIYGEGELFTGNVMLMTFAMMQKAVCNEIKKTSAHSCVGEIRRENGHPAKRRLHFQHNRRSAPFIGTDLCYVHSFL